MTKRSLPVAGLLALLAGCARHPATAHQPVVANLISLLAARPDLRTALTQAIDSARVDSIGSLDAFYRHVDQLVTWVPDQRVIVPKVLGLHYIINLAPGDALNRDSAFSDWFGSVARAWGEFLSSPASAPGIASFAANPAYHVDDFVRPPGGWRTFNEFFTREIRPGLRPIAAPADGAVIVSPADATWMGSHAITDSATITVKGADWRIADLLDGSPYAAAFRNGTYAHMFLRVTDYHRFHLPVGGVIRELRHVHGRVYIEVVRNAAGGLDARNGDTFQFNQERALVIVDSPAAGLVAVIPVGMTLISSVVLTPAVGDTVRKGDPLGYFQFGGSDIVLLFQEGRVRLEGQIERKYLEGARIGSSLPPIPPRPS
jgi:phosphatidylserine decarboxylase